MYVDVTDKAIPLTKAGQGRFLRCCFQFLSLPSFLHLLGPLLPMEQAFTMAETRGPVDHGVQIRFITEPVGTTEMGTLRHGGRRPAKDARANTYGVAVRVQGIAGQPFVVLNSGEKGGDSFGVQIKGANNRGASGALSSDSDLPESSYSRAKEFSGPLQDSMSDEEPGAHWNGRLLRSQSQASLTGPARAGLGNRSTSLLELAPQGASPGSTIDTAPLSSVDSLINKFDSHGGVRLGAGPAAACVHCPLNSVSEARAWTTGSHETPLRNGNACPPVTGSPAQNVTATWTARNNRHRAKALLVALAVPVRPRTGSCRVLRSHEGERRTLPCCRSDHSLPQLPNPGPFLSALTHQPWDPLPVQIVKGRKSLPFVFHFFHQYGQDFHGQHCKRNGTNYRITIHKRGQLLVLSQPLTVPRSLVLARSIACTRQAWRI